MATVPSSVFVPAAMELTPAVKLTPLIVTLPVLRKFVSAAPVIDPPPFSATL